MGPAPDDRVFRAFLRAIADDPGAALGAALAYEGLPPDARDALLVAVTAATASDGGGRDADAARVAALAPLLAVEDDAGRTLRLLDAIGARAFAPPSSPTAAALGDRAIVLVFPLYLAFAEALLVTLDADGAIATARHEPLERLDALAATIDVDGIRVERAPVGDAVDALARAVLRTERKGSRVPAEVLEFSRVFSIDS